MHGILNCLNVCTISLAMAPKCLPGSIRVKGGGGGVYVMLRSRASQRSLQSWCTATHTLDYSVITDIYLWL